MHKLVSELYPICRSLTGDGQRRTLEIVQRHIDLTVHEVPSGTTVFDWTIPREWNIRGAYIKDPSGKKIVDFATSNLHVMSYSVPVHYRMPLEELKKHLFTLPDTPDWIPYRTSYYKESWGFCISHRQFLALREGEYEVCIDSTLADGSLTYGEYYLPGECEDEILLSCHICHPSLANDNLSGIAVATFLAAYLTDAPHRCSYRFLFTPGQIGSLAWLSENETELKRIRAGLILACLGDGGNFNYKKSRRGDAPVDRAVAKVLQDCGEPYGIHEFVPYGYDERQFCSPGFNLPLGCLMRTPHGQYSEYHTSADNLELVKPESLADAFNKCLSIFDILENDRKYINQNPKGEPQLGKRGLYGSIGGATCDRSAEMAMLWILNYSDGGHSLLDIAAKSELSFATLKHAAERLVEHGLLKEGS
jgi:aminopeptidase-like protein